MAWDHFTRDHPHISGALIQEPPDMCGTQPATPGLAMQALNSYGRGIGRHGHSPIYAASLLSSVAGSPKGSIHTSHLPEMTSAAELAGLDVRKARLLMEKGPEVASKYHGDDDTVSRYSPPARKQNNHLGLLP